MSFWLYFNSDIIDSNFKNICFLSIKHVYVMTDKILPIILVLLRYFYSFR